MKICPHCETGFPDNATTCPTHGGLLSEIRDLKPGMLIRKTYRIARLLGKGGMGAVYLAQHELMDAPRALKFLSAELTNDEAFTRRFLREGRTLRQVRHRNVVDCGDLERSEDETLFFAMEFVDGPDLRGLLQAAAGPLHVSDALEIARGIALGLGAAHALGLVHRDIKPENVLMARDRDGWVPKIADFGIVATVESSTVYKTTRGSLLTPPYAAPEQWRGMKASELDGRTDLYALGGVLFEMLTGQTVFDAENYEGWFYQHLEIPPRLPSSVRPELADWKGLDALVLRLLAKNRDQRPKDVAETIRLLDAVEYVARARRVTKVEEVSPQPRPVEIPISASDSGQIARLSPEQDEAPAEKKPKKRTMLIPEILIGTIVAMVFLFSWWDGRQREEAQQEAEKFSAAVSQPAPSNIPPMELYEQAKTLSDKGQYEKAIPLLAQACNASYAQACSELGGLYAHAHGVAKDLAQATVLYAKACDGGDGTACKRLGDAYTAGAGIGKDKQKAQQAYTKGCSLGNKPACSANAPKSILDEIH